jgi:hypothetical protein
MKEIAHEGDLFSTVCADDLSCARRFDLSEDASSVEGVIDDLANRGRVGVNIHTVTSAEMADDTFCSNLQRHTRQLRIPSGLYVVDSKKPLI